MSAWEKPFPKIAPLKKIKTCIYVLLKVIIIINFIVKTEYLKKKQKNVHDFQW